MCEYYNQQRQRLKEWPRKNGKKHLSKAKNLIQANNRKQKEAGEDNVKRRIRRACADPVETSREYQVPRIGCHK